MNTPLPPLPGSWSALTWQQLCEAWTVKMRYGGNADVAGAAALLALALGSKFDLSVEATHARLTSSKFGLHSLNRGLQVSRYKFDERTGEQLYILKPDARPAGTLARARTGKPETYVVTARELAHMARQAVAWLQYPYGDPGEAAVKDEKGKVVREAREPVRGYVSNMRDALILNEQELVFCGDRMVAGKEWDRLSEEEQFQVIRQEYRNTKDKEMRRLVRRRWKRMDDADKRTVLYSQAFVIRFALPQAACNNLTWHQYRSLQAISPQLFEEGVSEEQSIELQAEFMAHCLVPGLPQFKQGLTTNDMFKPDYDFKYNAERAEVLVKWFAERLKAESSRAVANELCSLIPLGVRNSSLFTFHSSLSVLFHICFQAYQTALSYYAASYPLLFSDSGKTDPLRDALTGEVGTINTIMKYAGYAEQQQVYDSNLPFVLDILNTMTKEAKEIEKMNSKIKRK